MTLNELFTALQNPGMVVTIQETGESDKPQELVKIYAAGYAQLNSGLLTRPVEKLTVNNSNQLTALLGSKSDDLDP